MKFDDLVKDIEELESKAYSGEFNTDKYLISDNEIAKKILSAKNPSLSKDEIDMIIDSEEDLIAKGEEADKKELSKRKSNKRETDDERKKREMELEIHMVEKKAARKAKIKLYKEIYGPKVNSLVGEAKKLKDEIKRSIFQLIKESKDLTKKILTAVVQTSSAVSSISIIISAPPYNIPDAISLAMIVVEIYIDLITKVKSLIALLYPLKSLNLVTDKKNLQILSGILDAFVKIILVLWGKIISPFSEIIKKLIKSVLDLLKSKKSSIFRKATRKLKKLGHIPRDGVKKDRGEYNVDGKKLFSYEEDDIDEIKDLLDTFRLSGSQSDPKSRDRVIAYAKKIDEDTIDVMVSQLESLDVNIDEPIDISEITKDATESSSTYVYDVELPNGSILYGLTDEQLEEIKQSYILVINDIKQISNSKSYIRNNTVAKNDISVDNVRDINDSGDSGMISGDPE